jgi:5-formyltetrahydrofolate cyclo-ligase
MEAKRLLRAGVLQQRAARAAADREAAGRMLAVHGQAMAEGFRVVAAYAAVGTEPPTRPLLEVLIDAGKRVLLPVVSGSELHWGELHAWSALVRGAHGLRQPEPDEQAAAAAVAADLVLVPALAVDRAGHRLGRGRGHYDRWLPRSAGQAVAVVYDDELLAEVPHEAHDRRVVAALTPAGVTPLGW